MKAGKAHDVPMFDLLPGYRLKGVNNTAQGNALGINRSQIQALKGQHNPAWPEEYSALGRVQLDSISPFQGLNSLGCITPGALPRAVLLLPFKQMALRSGGLRWAG